MGDITILWVVMLLIALASFAPLGIFIYRFSQKADDPLGSAHPAHQPNPKIEAWVNGLLGRFLSSQQATPDSSASQAVVDESASASEAETSQSVKKLRGRFSRKKTNVS